MRDCFSGMPVCKLNFRDCNVIQLSAVGQLVIVLSYTRFDVDCMKLVEMSSYNLSIPPLVVEQHVTMFTYN